MKHTLLKTATFLWLLAFWQPANAQLWEVLNPLPEGSGGYRGHFLNDNNGWVFRTGSYQLLRTRDGGNTWTELYPMTGMRHIFMVDTLVGYMIVKDGVRKYLFRTTDGGLNWEQKSVYFQHIDQGEGYSIFLERKFLYFLNQMEGFLVDDNNGELMRTSDGGDTWSSVLDPYYMINDIVFINDTLGWIGLGSTENGGIYYTVDGGLNWNNTDLNHGAIYHIDVLNNDAYFATYFHSPNCYGYPSSGFVKSFDNFQNSEITDFYQNYNFALGKYVNDSTIFLSSTPKVFKMHKDSINPLEIIDFSEHLGGFSRIEPHKRHTFLYGNKIVRYTDTLYVGIQQPFDAVLNGIKLFPNPAKHEIYVTNLPNQGHNCAVRIISVMGNTVKTIQLLGNNKIDVSDIPSGLYFITIQHNNKLITKRIYISH